MEIIEKMPDNEFNSICDAGVELVQEISKVMAKYGISLEHAFNVLVVAAAGVTAGSGLTSNDLATGVDAIVHMWSVRNVNGTRQVVFDPPHLRQGFIPEERDLSVVN